MVRAVALLAAALAAAACGPGVPGESGVDWRLPGDKADDGAVVLTTGAAYFPASRVLEFTRGDEDAWVLATRWREAGLNAVVVDIKEGDGIVLVDVGGGEPYLPDWDDGQERALEANIHEDAADLPALVDVFHEAGLKVILRQVIFKDRALVHALPDLAIQDSESGGAWGKTKQWINPWNLEAGNYGIEIALRALASGADEIQFDYIRFPDAWTGDFSTQSFPGKPAGDRRCDAVAAFLERARAAIGDWFPDALLGVDVFGYVANGRNVCDALGQHVGMMAAHVDVVYPMQYPSHWAWKGHVAFGTEHPETRPRRVYQETTERLRAQLEDYLGDKAQRVLIVPWVQAFYIKSFGGLRMQAPAAGALDDYVVEQIHGLALGGGQGFALWGFGSSHLQAEQGIASTLDLRYPQPDDQVDGEPPEDPETSYDYPYEEGDDEGSDDPEGDSVDAEGDQDPDA